MHALVSFDLIAGADGVWVLVLCLRLVDGLCCGAHLLGDLPADRCGGCTAGLVEVCVLVVVASQGVVPGHQVIGVPSVLLDLADLGLLFEGVHLDLGLRLILRQLLVPVLLERRIRLHLLEVDHIWLRSLPFGQFELLRCAVPHPMCLAGQVSALVPWQHKRVAINLHVASCI